MRFLSGTPERFSEKKTEALRRQGETALGKNVYLCWRSKDKPGTEVFELQISQEPIHLGKESRIYSLLSPWLGKHFLWVFSGFSQGQYFY